MRAILFDFDYTLADSSEGVFQCINYALTRMGEPPRGWKECCDTIGLTLPQTYNRLTGDLNPEKERKFYRLFLERADDVMVAKTNIYPTVPEMLRTLKKRGFRLGIVSTKFRFRIIKILQRRDLAESFDGIIGGEDVKAHKPNPEGLNRMLTRLKVDKQDAVFVGDSVIDAETAGKGEVSFIAVLSGQTAASAFHPFDPMAIIDNVGQLPRSLAAIDVTGTAWPKN
jgi:phosphoglycolate phosphatase